MIGHKAPHSFYFPEAKYAHSFDKVDVPYPDTAFKLADKPEWIKQRLNTWHGIYGPLFDPFRFVCKLESSIRVGHINLIKGMRILRFRKVKTMWRFVPDHAKPRFVFISLTDPIRSHVSNDISVIARHNFTIARDIKFGIEVLPLAFVSNESVKARPWVIVFFTHVPFPKISGLVSGVVKHTGEILKILWILGEIIYNGMSVGIFT